MMKKIFLLVWLLMFSSLSVTVLSGSETLESSPWVGWRKAFQAYDQAEVYKNDRNYKQALIYYTRGRDYFAAIRRNFPDWNSKVVSDRVALCENVSGKCKIWSAKNLPASPADVLLILLLITVRAAATRKNRLHRRKIFPAGSIWKCSPKSTSTAPVCARL